MILIHITYCEVQYGAFRILLYCFRNSFEATPIDNISHYNDRSLVLVSYQYPKTGELTI